jgi:LuxR family maltose regulon positive regulatory protein
MAVPLPRPRSATRKFKQQADGPVKSKKKTPAARQALKSGRPTIKMPAAPVLAKISPPRLRNAYVRERVLGRLDELMDRALIWLSAPPGYGKTTVVASWLQARKVTAIWYQCDEGDADIASFFYFLSLAVLPVLRAPARPLPHLAPELYPELATFVRNYFRELCSQLVAPIYFVLDNWQELPATAPMREFLPIAVNELPAGVCLMIISREDPDANLSRLSTIGQMATLGREALQLSREETAGIAAGYVPSADQRSVLTAQQLYALTQGWAAGLTALLRHEASSAAPRWDTSQTTMQTVFNYLSAETFDRLEGTVKDFLLKTACLEHIAVPVAQQLTGNARANDILNTLVRHNVFTQQRPAAGTYYYHPLFRQFLQSRAASQFSVAQQRELLIAAARTLVEHNDSEAAIALLVEAGSWSEAAQLILSIAPAVVQQGRFATLSDWIAALPEPMRCKDGWLMYWHGVQQLATAFPEARSTLERSYELFRTSDDGLGQMLAAAAILQHHHYSYVDFSPMLPWIGILEALLLDEPYFPSPTMELSVLTGLFSAIMLCAPQNPRLNWCAERMAYLMQTGVGIRGEAAAVAALLHYYATSGHNVRARGLRVACQNLVEKVEIGPAARLEILWMIAFHYHLSGEGTRCHALLNDALEIARHHNLSAFEHRLRVSILQSTNATADGQALADEFERREPMTANLPALLAAHDLHARAMFCLARGDLGRALRYAEKVYSVTAVTGWMIVHALAALGIAEVLCEMGRFDDAAKHLAQCMHIASGANAPLLQFSCALVEAEIARRTDQAEEFSRMLSNAFAVGQREGYANAVHANSIFLARLIPYALERRIEVEYCRWLIRKRGIKPPARDIAQWPWPIRIRTLGHFEVLVDDQVIEFGGRPQHKPLDLLKALLVQHHGIDCGILMERLWPDLDGDSARNALDLALHRLRKLLKHKDAVTLDQGRLQFDASQVWVDAFALERLCGRGGSSHGDLAADLEGLLHLYQGAFLADQDKPWAFAARERLRSMFIRHVAVLGALLQEQKRWEPLTMLYRRVIELDPLAEDFHRGLMQCLIAQDRGAEAAAAYLRCKESLGRLLGSEPSASTRALYASL